MKVLLKLENVINKIFNMKKLIFLILLISIYPLLTQEDTDNSFYYDNTKLFFTDAYALPSASPDSIKVFAFFKISYNSLTFTKEDESTWKCKPLVILEFRDTNTIIRSRIDWENSVYLQDFELTKSRSQFIYGFANVTLSKGNYNISSTLFENNNYKIKELKLPLLISYPAGSYATMYHPFFIKSGDEKSKLSCPSVLNGSFPFSSKPCQIVFPINYTGNPPSFNYKIEINKTFDKQISWIDAFILSGTVNTEENKTFNLNNKSGIDEIYLEEIASSPSDKFKSGLVKIDYPEAKNAPGSYNIILWQDKSKDTVRIPFKIEWENIPHSLKNADYSAQAMYYLLTDDEFSKIKKGNPQEIYRKLIDWWKKSDPTPFTVFNEAMNEYFSRVDYAFFNFKTITEKDGSKTDRGKIYILHGKAGKIERNLTKNNVIEEKWIYPALKKAFVFITTAKGILTLDKIEDIK